MPPRRFKPADTLQQIIGGFLFTGPFVVESGAWELARAMSYTQAFLITILAGIIGYLALYKADKDREAVKERSLLGIPLRFISLLLTAFSSVALLIWLTGAASVNSASLTETLQFSSIAVLFNIIGAAAADSVF